MASNHEKNKSFSIGCIDITKKFSKKLGFATIFNRFKLKGNKLSNFITGLVSHKLHFNQSINHASSWLNEDHIQSQFNLDSFKPKTLYRSLENIGSHERSIMTFIQKRLLELYNFNCTDINMDWSSLTLFGDKSNLGKYGYSREHRPDKKQITFGISELREPINIPITLTIAAGNKLDKEHFQKTFKHSLKALDEESLIILDRGARTDENKKLIRSQRCHYLMASSLSKKIDVKIADFNKEKAILSCVKSDKKILCRKYSLDGEYNYLFFSEQNYEDRIKARERNSIKKMEELKEMERRIKSGRKYKKKKYEMQQLIAVEKFALQKRLKYLTQEELIKRMFEKSITGREGFFLLISSKNLTEKDALEIYRSRDSIEKIIDSLKNVIRIKPVRVWTDNAIKGALMIGYLAQLILALLKYENKEFKDLHSKTIVQSLRNLTLTLEYVNDFVQNRIISNIDEINQVILGPKPVPG